jgi:hypothetical protein
MVSKYENQLNPFTDRNADLELFIRAQGEIVKAKTDCTTINQAERQLTKACIDQGTELDNMKER